MLVEMLAVLLVDWSAALRVAQLVETLVAWSVDLLAVETAVRRADQWDLLGYLWVDKLADWLAVLLVDQWGCLVEWLVDRWVLKVKL